MAWTVTGAYGRTWHGADWVARNAFAFVLPALERAGAPTLARRCAAALHAGTGTLDLSDLLDDERASDRWRRSVDAALGTVRAEGADGWNEPERFGPFLAALAELAELGRGDGNRHVISLAERLTP